ncbi:MAG TPA: hypothetical protein VKZ44_06755 [Taishania sp.]|nr:hypothetical protein [Taishania sp.]
MKIAFTLLLVIISFGYIHAQTNEGIHTIVIYEAGKEGFIEIDHTGKTNYGQQLDLSELNKNIGTYLINNGYSFHEANDNPPLEASQPTN